MKIYKLFSIYLIILGIYQPGFTQNLQNEYTLECKFTNLPDGTRAYLRTQERDTINSVISSNETFTFKGKLEDNGRFYFIHFDSVVSKVSSNAIFVTNSKIQVLGKLGDKKVIVYNSPQQNEYITLQEMMNKQNDLLSKKWEIVNSKNAAVNDAFTRNDSATIKKLNKIMTDEMNEIDKEREKFHNHLLDWLLEHPNSMITAYTYTKILEAPTTDLKKINRIYDNLSTDVKNSYYGKIAKELLSFKNSTAGIEKMAIIPNFTVLDNRGNAVKIHDLIKKSPLTLIDCWASWCAPCRQEIPHLKSIYETYKEKGLQIIGISSDVQKDKWIKAIQEDGTEWLHFIQESNKSLTKTFSIQAIPAYILVDSKGRLRSFDCALSHIKNFGGSLRGLDLATSIDANL
ncbi:TlpA disulfide reductase family protein [Chitinophaga deserti]|uniref:TlpA disulfide reductase family protein n=1 Tax=Chitinophaga deserti TaxID=2164099 RepID=UPI000D6D906F|nr:TlpA disulfide reductase family protein [Chitinophaga deserti]